nr:transcription factor grauzone-like [Bactrocera oleae]
MFNETCCLLCLESSKDQIDLDSKEGIDLNGREVIELHFKEELDLMSQFEMKIICRKCWNLVETFHKFYKNVKQLHNDAVYSLKSVTFEADSLEIKEEIMSNDDTQVEPLTEYEIKVEECILPSEIVSEALVVTDETLLEESIQNSISSYAYSLDLEELKRENEEDKHSKIKSHKIHKRKGVNKKTEELDEYIAKKNFKFTCCICKSPLENFTHLKSHFHVAHQTSGYVLCCGKKLHQRGLLIDHINFHEDPDYFKCKHCGKRMTERRSIDLHLQYAHGDRERVSYLKQHYNIHVAEDQKTEVYLESGKTEEQLKELRRRRNRERQRAYYHRQKELKKNEKKKIKIKKETVPKSNAERQRQFRQRKEKNWTVMKIMSCNVVLLKIDIKMFNETCCLLCLESSKDQIDLDSKEGIDLHGREVIELHFKEELDMMSQFKMKIICLKCWNLVETFHKFYKNVKQVHKDAVYSLKSVTFETDSLEIKEEIISNDDTHVERLTEYETKVEESMLPASNSLNDVGNSSEIVSKALDVTDETLLEECIENSISSYDYSSDSEELKSGNEEDKRSKRKSHKINKRKSVNKKTEELDEYIAKKNFKFTCCICQISLENFTHLKSHFRGSHQTSGYVLCCGKKLRQRGLLIDHINFHEDPDYFKCKHCGKRMKERRSIDLHLQYAHGNRERVHRCSICSKGFFRASCLKQHYNIHVTEDQKTVLCLECGKTFPDDVELGKHMRITHLNAYAKICDICGVSMKGRDALERHQAEHAGVSRKLLKCDLCDTTLTTKHGLVRHMKTRHTEEYQTPQVCPMCSKVSPSLQAHRNHIWYMHSLQRKHVCKLCDKAFKRLTDFKEHMATHTGEDLYTCSFCPQTFKSNANMYSHRRKKHAKEWAEQCALKKSLAVPLKQAVATD